MENQNTDSHKRGTLEEATASYLAHVVEGKSIRVIAQLNKVHPSTIMRRIRKVEGMRDDPVLDQYLNRAEMRNKAAITPDKKLTPKEGATHCTPEEQFLLRCLCEAGTKLVVSKGLEKAVVMRSNADGTQSRMSIVNAHLAGACVIKDWLRCCHSGRVSLYEITEVGRAALKRALALDLGKGHASNTYSERPTEFSEQHKDWGERTILEAGRRTRKRVNLRESPLTGLARKKGRDGKVFLSRALVEAGDRLREDFELAQMGPRVGQNWDRFLTGGARGNFGSTEGGLNDAQTRLSAALTALGPGLSDIVLRCCCFLEGLETAEKRMGWSARSGKIVLRIALERLRHYYDTEAPAQRKIG